MVDTIQADGAMRNVATAALVTPEPGTTQQIGVDNSEITNMRATVGQMNNQSEAQRA